MIRNRCVTFGALGCRLRSGLSAVVAVSFVLTFGAGVATGRSGNRTRSSSGEALRSASQEQMKQPVTVADIIRMTRFGEPSYDAGGTSTGIVAKFSPDGKQFVTVLRKGNLEKNTNEYSLVLFSVADLFHSPKPRILASLATSSNRPAIQNPTWLSDNNTILFLGENIGEQAQIYSVRCNSRELRQIAHHPSSITSFSSNGQRIAYVAESPVFQLTTMDVARRGVRVKQDHLRDLIRGTSGGGEFGNHLLFVRPAAGGEGQDREVHIEGKIGSNPVMSLSPDGAHLLIQTELSDIPERWRNYKENLVLTGVFRYELVETNSGKSTVLLDAPISSSGSEALWSPDSQSVVISHLYLPLNTDDSAEQEARKSHSFLVEVRIPSRTFVAISNGNFRLLKWDTRTNDVICESERGEPGAGNKVRFHKNGETWSQTNIAEKPKAQLPNVVLDEDMNTSPRIVAIDPYSGGKSLVMDLNPEFEHLALGKVEEVRWTDGRGNENKGGLYWPLNYVTGRKYPLVIQTHGWNPDKFWADGPYTTAFAAQALAAKGFLVLQDSGPPGTLYDTIDEAPRAMAAFEGAIDYLSQKGLIDLKQIGIIGFSRTCYHVAYTLTHSKYQFAAAAIADGIDAGYFQYMVSAGEDPQLTSEFDKLNGAAPFDEGLNSWISRSPLFLLDKVRTPLLVQALGPASLLYEWDWYSGLSSLGKAVDLIYIPDGTHILQKPWDRMVSQQGDVDWFFFWLKGEEDPDPAKAEQYKRWRDFRKLQAENEKKFNTTQASPH